MEPQSSIKDQIDSVSKSTIKYIFKKLFIQLFLLLVYFVTLLYLFIKDTNKVVNGPPASDDGGYFLKTLFYFLMPPAVLYFSYKWVKGKIIKQFIQQFAEVNNFSYSESENLSNLDGNIFVFGKDRYYINVCTGYFNNLPVRLFNYYYRVYSQQNVKKHNSTVFEIQFENLLPPLMLLVDHHDFGGSMTVNFKKPAKLKLEGDFDKFFDLYTEQDLEIEVLQVFTPDFMIQMRDNWKNFSIEFTTNRIYIYSYKLVLNRKDLQQMFELVQFLIKKLEPVLVRMQGSLKETLAVFSK